MYLADRRRCGFEAEFFFAIIKISLIVGLILAGLIVDLGGGPDHDRIGFRVRLPLPSPNKMTLVNSTGNTPAPLPSPAS